MAKPKIIDVYAGVGGLSLGAARAGFTVALAVELDKHAVAAHEKNFRKLPITLLKTFANSTVKNCCIMSG